MAKINIKIWPDGSKSQIVVEGVTGSGCEELTKNLEESVLQSGAKKEYTPDYYLEDKNVVNETI